MLRRLEKHRVHQKYFLRSGPRAGQEVIGSSSVSKIGDDPGGLLHWSWQKGIEGKDYRAERDSTAEIGTIAHAKAESFLIGDELDLFEFAPENVALAEKAFEKFKEWWEAQKLIWMHSELQLVSHEYEFGGTLDIIARDQEKNICQIDLKAVNSLRTSMGIQVAGGYNTLYNENFPDEPIDKVCILRLPKGGTDVEPKWLPPETFAYYQKAFLANLSSFYARRALDKVCPMAYVPKWKRK